jgi:Epoxide hydrolase N terminus
VTPPARYWATDYDWRNCETRLNALPEFKTGIDGVDIHFIHVKSPHPCALPLIMTHGWPRFGHRVARGRRPAHRPNRARRTGRGRVRPRAAVPARLRLLRRTDRAGWDPGRTARAWAELMNRLGYTRYVAQGGDLGAIVTDVMGRQAPKGLLGIHMNLLVTTLGAPTPPPGDTEEERAALEPINTFTTSGFGYFLEQSTRPQTIGYALLDSPVALAA